MADFKINTFPAAICISTCQDGDNLQFHNHFHIKTQLFQTFFKISNCPAQNDHMLDSENNINF